MSKFLSDIVITENGKDIVFEIPFENKKEFEEGLKKENIWFEHYLDLVNDKGEKIISKYSITDVVNDKEKILKDDFEKVMKIENNLYNKNKRRGYLFEISN